MKWTFVVAAAVAGTLSATTLAQTNLPGRILCESGAAPGGLFEIGGDGSNIVNVTPNTFDDGPCSSGFYSKTMYPSVSTNGLLAVMSSLYEVMNNLSGATYRIGLLNTDGTNWRWLTTRDGAVLSDSTVVPDLYPVISRDGSKVAFVSRRNDVQISGNWQSIQSLFVVSTTGDTNLQQLTFPQPVNASSDVGSIYCVAWSPDSSKLAFRGLRYTAAPGDPTVAVRQVLSVIDSNGANETVLAWLPSTGQSYDIDWSPDGAHLVVDYGGEAQGAPAHRIIVYDYPAGTGTNLFNAPYDAAGGAGGVRFSPDSQRLVTELNNVLWSTKLDDTDVVAIYSNFPAVSGQPVWWMAGTPVPAPDRLEFSPDPIVIYVGGPSAQVTPTLFDAQSNVIVKVATGWQFPGCNCCTPRADDLGNVSAPPGSSTGTFQICAGNGGVTNCFTVIVLPPEPNLGVTAITSANPVLVGSNFMYSITVTNTGPLPATSVTVTDALPAEVGFVSASAGCTNIGNLIACDLGSITNGDSASATITVTALDAGLATNVVTVSEAETDIDPSDNAFTNVTAITLVQNQPPVAVCQNVTTNAGGDCMADVPASAVDNGSFDPDGTIASLALSPAGPYPVGATPVTLTVVDNQGASNSCNATITVVTNPPDLSVSVELNSSTCSNTSKRVICVLTGDLALVNHDATYVNADFQFTTSCTTSSAVARCKLAGLLTLHQFNLVCTPASTLGIYLSNDGTFDASDTLLKRLQVKKFKKPFAGGKPVKLTGKVPKGVNLSGKFLIFVVDDTRVISETDETNNTATLGPLP